MNRRCLVLDNRDSFVFNLVEDIHRMGFDCDVVRSDLELSQLRALCEQNEYGLVVISPGPGRPSDHRVVLPFLRSDIDLPVLGVCLGMQAMVEATGGEIGRSKDGPVHGRACTLLHQGDPIFEGIASRFRVGRYHSLSAHELPDELVCVAQTIDSDIPMAIRHRHRPWVGLQFHPESILTPEGFHLIQNIMGELACTSI